VQLCAQDQIIILPRILFGTF